MSFAEQERVLFDLLFDSELRENFSRQGVEALSAYALDDAERRDFSVVRSDALEMDARMRRDLLLTHVCRSYPVSFAVVSSLPGGLDLIKGLIDTETMRSPPLERLVVFGRRLRDSLARQGLVNEAELPRTAAIVEAELGMSWTAAALKGEMLSGGEAPNDSGTVPVDWCEHPVCLGDYVSASILPGPYDELKSAFCHAGDTQLWNYLKQSPVSKTQRRRILDRENPRLLVLRATVKHKSLCEPVVEHRTVELSEGFAPLLQHIDGSTAVDKLLQQFSQAGADEKLLAGVKAGFRQLYENGMLRRAA